MFSTNNACAKKVQEFLTKLGSFLKKKGQSIEDTGEHSVLQHPWQNDLDHLANRLGEVPCKIAEKPTDEQMKKLCDEPKSMYDFVLVDSPAGIESGFRNASAGAGRHRFLPDGPKRARFLSEGNRTGDGRSRSRVLPALFPE